MKNICIAIFILSSLLLSSVFAQEDKERKEHPHCEVAVVGAGLSGIYSAYRLATSMDSPVRPWDICVFERSDKFGGRLLPLVNDQTGDILEMGVPHFDAEKSPLFNELVQRMGIPTQCKYLMAQKQEEPTGARIMSETIMGQTRGQGSVKRQVATEGTQQVLNTQAQMTGTQAQMTGTQEPMGTQMQGTQGLDTEAQQPTEEEKAECGKALVKFFFVRNRIVYPNSTEGMPFELSQATQAQGTQAQGTQAQGTQAQGTQAQGTQAQGTQAQGTQAKRQVATEGTQQALNTQVGTQAQAQGTQAQGTQPPGTQAQGTQAQGQENQESSKAIPDIAQIAFDAVYGSIINKSDLDRLAQLPKEEKWTEISRLIQEISNVTYKDVPVNRLSVAVVLRDVLNLDEEFFKAAILMSEKHPFLQDILTMNFEHFSLWFIKNKASEGMQDIRAVQGFSGLKTVVDMMVNELRNLGVQFHLKSNLDRFELFDDGLLLDIDGFERPIFVRRLILALSAKNLRNFRNSKAVALMSDEASQSLGSLKSLGLRKGALFYDVAWWKNYGLSDQIVVTDTLMQKISFHDSIDCTDQNCSGYVEIENYGERAHDFGVDIINPIDISTVLNILSKQGGVPEEREQEVFDEGMEMNSKIEPKVTQQSYEGTLEPKEPKEPKETRGTQAQGTQARSKRQAETQPKQVTAPMGRVTGQRGTKPLVTQPRETVTGQRGTKPLVTQPRETVSEPKETKIDTEVQSLGLGMNETDIPIEDLSPEEQYRLQDQRIFVDRSRLILSVMHKALVYILSTVPGFDMNIEGPRYAIWANWDDDPIFHYGVIAQPSRINLKTFTSSLSEPIPGAPVHLVNSDFTELAAYDGGLESSIVQVERTFSKLFGMSKPDWYTESIYTAQVNLE